MSRKHPGRTAAQRRVLDAIEKACSVILDSVSRIAEAERARDVAQRNYEGQKRNTIAYAKEAIELKARIRELEAELAAYTDAVLYDALMSGPALKDWNRSQLDRARRVTEARRVKDEVQK